MFKRINGHIWFIIVGMMQKALNIPKTNLHTCMEQQNCQNNQLFFILLNNLVNGPDEVTLIMVERVQNLKNLL